MSDPQAWRRSWNRQGGSPALRLREASQVRTRAGLGAYQVRDGPQVMRQLFGFIVTGVHRSPPTASAADASTG
jgi:hypothetical protein